eukprot:TRINITY_DN1473_c0_g1_i3.p1 TRINITY_DN1473_c0_g1~~TRINITY_DN1473_c0_g1_i3.p1  ORF type:complete len:111 (+),score=13.00 TRINITY_DN1473_c0_g1_i3:248-580(+)
MSTKASQLSQLYKDEDSSLQTSLDEISLQVGPTLFNSFYDSLNNVKEYHKSHTNQIVPRPEQQLWSMYMHDDELAQFSGEESYGRYLDLNEFYNRYSGRATWTCMITQLI